MKGALADIEHEKQKDTLILIIAQLVSVCGKWIVLIKEILVLCHNDIDYKIQLLFST